MMCAKIKKIIVFLKFFYRKLIYIYIIDDQKSIIFEFLNISFLSNEVEGVFIGLIKI